MFRVLLSYVANFLHIGGRRHNRISSAGCFVHTSVALIDVNECFFTRETEEGGLMLHSVGQNQAYLLRQPEIGLTTGTDLGGKK